MIRTLGHLLGWHSYRCRGFQTCWHPDMHINRWGWWK